MHKIEQFPEYQVPGANQHYFYPYESNGGSVVAIAGDDYAAVAADTRLTSGYSIHTRNQNKLFKLTDKTVLASCGCWCDTLSLTAFVKKRIQMYHHEHNKIMTSNAIAQMLSCIMYHNRFYPYYVSNILAGLDENGKGVVYSYDPVGHCELSYYKAGGSAGALLQPVLDNQIGYKNQIGIEKEPITKEKAVGVIYDTFISATERDIYTGDAVIINVITKDGVEVKEFDLRKD
ncbi:proteasome subunit beta type-1 [Condylostylus longicornis]|uniref:proteasome subunit beta type-1 n=1 Tax=Condylostylus longicornis TaxID=2530218 RepID=UPI00244E0BF9|nr:proteasome subunit beta type-1 [Condylostylus longicornis]